jgi:lipoprotein-anchoring transpeptidase ErfK/SrfK
MQADACVDLGQQRAWLIEGGAVVHGPVPLSSGRAGAETPTGDFHVEWKHIDHVSSEYRAPMPYSVFFAPGGIAFHEGPINHPSAGCIRLGRADARTFFERLEVGNHVQVR